VSELVKCSTQVCVTNQDESSEPRITTTPAITEPFTAVRAAPRLIFDFGAMVSLLKSTELNRPVLDFGAGSGWISELCVRMGLQTVAFDIHGDLKGCLENRARADARIVSIHKRPDFG